MEKSYQTLEKGRYSVRDVTPKSMLCIVGTCPSIYEGLRELTTKNSMCIVGSCPPSYEAIREGKEVYLIVGTLVNPSKAGLEDKVGEGEALIEVPREIIDNKEK